MIESLKMMEVKNALENFDNNILLKQLFLDFPTLNTVEISKTSEYNDNDYSNYFSVKALNGLLIEDEMVYAEDEGDEDEGDDEAVETGPRFHETEIAYICCVLNSCEDYWDTNYEDDTQSVNREDFVNKGSLTNDKAFDAYYVASKTNQKIEDLSVFKNSPNWALYYCYDLKEKLPENLVTKIFKDNVKFAVLYAIYVSKEKLPKKLENDFKTIEKKFALDSFNNERTPSFEEKQDIFYILKYKEFTETI